LISLPRSRSLEVPGLDLSLDLLLEKYTFFHNKSRDYPIWKCEAFLERSQSR
jgi:hypothetical protein